MRFTRISLAIAFLLCLWVPYCVALQGPSNGKPAQQTGQLNITVLNLPQGTPARITLSAATRNVGSLAQSGTLSTSPGTYTITAEPVHAGSATYYPTLTTQTVKVHEGTSNVTVDYYGIVPDTTRVLDAEGARSLTVTDGRTHVSIGTTSAAGRSLHPGDILAAASSARAPEGLLVKVISLRTENGRIEADVRQASFIEAITRGRFSATVPFSPKTLIVKTLSRGNNAPLGFEEAKLKGLINSADSPAVGCSEATPAVVLPFNYTFDGSVSVSQGPAGASVSGVTLGGSMSLCPRLQFNIDWGFLRVNSVRVIASLGEDTDFTASAQVSGFVDAEKDLISVQTPPIPMVVAGVPFSLQGDATLTIGASVEVDSSFSASVRQTANTELGLNYDHGKVNPIDPTPSFSITPMDFIRDASITGQAYVGLKLEVIVSVPVLPNIGPEVYVEPRAYFSWVAPPASLDFGLEADAGINLQIGDYDILSVNTPPFPLFNKTIWKAPPAPPPTLSSLQPPSADAGSRTEQVTLSGANFGTDAVVLADGKPLITTYYNPGMLSATMPTAKMATPGTVDLSAFDPDSGATSQTIGFEVISPSPGPVISNLIPASVQAGAPAQALTIYGSGFLPSTTVAFHGIPHAATYASGSQLSISLTKEDVAKAGSYPVVVTNADADGPLTYSVQFPVGEAMKPVLGSAMQGMNPQHTNTSAAIGPVTRPVFSAIVTPFQGKLWRIGGDGTLVTTKPGNCPDFCPIISTYSPSGVLRWSTQIAPPAALQTIGDFIDMAVGNTGIVYGLGLRNGLIYALDAETGSQLWSNSLNGGDWEPWSGMTIGADGTVYVPTGTMNYQSAAMDPDGTIKWDNFLSGFHGLVLSNDETLAYMTGRNAPVGGYSTVDGTLVLSSASRPYCPTMWLYGYANNTLYALTNYYHLESFTSDLSACADMEPNTSFKVPVADGIQAITNQGVIISSLNGVFSGNSLSGAVLWTSTQQFGGGLADANGNLFEAVLKPGANSYDIVALDGKSGKTLWQYTFPDPVANDLSANPILIGPDGSLYITAGTTLYRAAPNPEIRVRPAW